MRSLRAGPKITLCVARVTATAPRHADQQVLSGGAQRLGDNWEKEVVHQRFWAGAPKRVAAIPHGAARHVDDELREKVRGAA